MRILFIGDVVGLPGRRIVKPALRRLREQFRPALVIANAENCAGGAGMTPGTANELLHSGCDVLTGGNHTWDQAAILPTLASDERLLRPANYPESLAGRGFGVYRAANGVPVAVANLQGRVFMEEIDDPFSTADRILEDLAGVTRVVFVDFHAEATSEKVALGWYLDGRVSAVVGTHTHVPTADARVLPSGTAYITDAGMTGPHDSVIGVEKQDVLARFLEGRPARLKTARNDVRLCGVVVEIDELHGRALSIQRIEYPDSGERETT